MYQNSWRAFSTRHRFVLLAAALLLIAIAAPASAQEKPAAAGSEELLFETDRNQWLAATDGDSWPDLTEELGGTDPYDAASNAGNLVAAELPSEKELDFPSSPCRGTFTQRGLRLCITGLKTAATYRVASATCSVIGARVCGFEDLYYIYNQTAFDASYNPLGKWLGDFTADNRVLCGNKSITFNNDPDINDFDGECDSRQSRFYWCCHTKN